MIKISKFAEALGVMTLTAGNLILEIKPLMGDKRKLYDIIGLAKDKKKLDSETIGKLIEHFSNIIKRNNEEETIEDIKIWAEHFFEDIMKQFMVGFRITTQEKLDELEKKELSLNNQ